MKKRQPGKSKKRSYSYVGSWRVGVSNVVIPIVLALTFLHNSIIVEQTKARDLLYDSWEIVTVHTELFNAVQDRDALISRNQNDAYETNAGSFYYFTGKRLTYLYQPQALWPEFGNCLTDSDCVLPPAKTRVLGAIPNLKRNNSFSESLTRNSFGDDWIDQLLKPGFLDGIDFWAFELFAMTPNTSAAYLIPISSTDKTDFLNVNNLSFYTITRNNRNEFTPAFNGVCLREKSLGQFVEVNSNQYFVSEWFLPENGVSPSGERVSDVPQSLIQQQEVGSCA